MPSTGGRKSGVGNYTKAKLENMFAVIRAIRTVGGEDWDNKTAPTGNQNMRWNIMEATEIKELIGDEASIVGGEDRYDVETNEFTPPAPAPATTQPVPLLLGQPTQPTQSEEVTQSKEVSTISSSKKRHYNCKADNEANFMKVIATLQQQALELQQRLQDKADEERKQALELQQRRQEKADEERKVLLQALLAQLTTSGGGPSGAGHAAVGRAVGHTTSPITPQVTNVINAAEGRKLKRKVNSLQQHHNYSSDDSSDSSSNDLLGIN
eukprot:jgi/Psemu1/47946/gm1.47946_g